MTHIKCESINTHYTSRYKKYGTGSHPESVDHSRVKNSSNFEKKMGLVMELELAEVEAEQ